MSRWLPDSEAYAHPRLSWLLQYAFDVALAGMFRVEHDLPAGFRLPPGTLVVSNHLRDSDGPIIGTVLLRRQGLSMRAPLPYFAMREDLLRRDALANLLYASPPSVARLLGRLPLGWLFNNMPVLPMRRVREFTWQDTLAALRRQGLAHEAPAALFNRRGQRELCSRLGTLPTRVDAIDPWGLGRLRLAYWGLRRLRLATLRRLAPAFRATVDQHLGALAQRLERGAQVYLAPEGCVSPDGRFGRIRAGSWRLPALVAAPVSLFPASLSYDPLGPGRTRVVVRAGTLLHNVARADPRRAARLLRGALRGGCVVTPSHLLAHFLITCNKPFSTAELALWLAAAQMAARRAGWPMDPLFARQPIARLAGRRFVWLRRKRLVHRMGDAWATAEAVRAPRGRRDLGATVQRLDNALRDRCPNLDAVLPRCTPQ